MKALCEFNEENYFFWVESMLWQEYSCYLLLLPRISFEKVNCVELGRIKRRTRRVLIMLLYITYKYLHSLKPMKENLYI